MNTKIQRTNTAKYWSVQVRLSNTTNNKKEKKNPMDPEEILLLKEIASKSSSDMKLSAFVIVILKLKLKK